VLHALCRGAQGRACSFADGGFSRRIDVLAGGLLWMVREYRPDSRLDFARAELEHPDGGDVVPRPIPRRHPAKISHGDGLLEMAGPQLRSAPFVKSGPASGGMDLVCPCRVRLPRTFVAGAQDFRKWRDRIADSRRRSLDRCAGVLCFTFAFAL